MLYINKEYGFDGKPPYFKEFYEEATKGPLIKKSDFPSEKLVGVSLDYKHCNGAMFICSNGAMFGVRVAVLDRDEWIDCNEFLYGKKSSVLAINNNHSFLALKYKNVIVKFCVINNNEVAFKVECNKKATVRVIFYPCCFTRAKFKINGNNAIANSDGIATINGNISFNQQYIFEAKNRYHVFNASKTQAKFVGELFLDADLIDNGAFGEAIYEYNLSKNKNSVFGHAFLDEENFTPIINSINDCFYNINNKEIEFSKNCLLGSGSLAKNASLVGRNSLINLIYDPYLKKVVSVSSRKRINEHFAFHQFSDSLSLLLSLNFVNYLKLLEQAKLLITEPAVGGCLLLKFFRQGLRGEKLKELYNLATKSFKKTLILETETNRASEVFSVYKTCLKIFNLEVLELVSKEVDKENSKNYAELIKNLKNLVNQEFYCEQYKTYFNKTLEGEFILDTSSRKFYTLLAGVVEHDKLKGVLNDLLNTKNFFSENGILENSQKSKKSKTIDVFTNFLIYQGLRRYNLFNECAVLATKTTKLWDEINLKGILFSLTYNVEHRVRAEGGFNLGANLLGLIGINEVISFDLFKLSNEPSLSFGSAKNGQLISNYIYNGHVFDIKQSEKDTILVVDGIQVLKIDDATTTISSFIETKNGCEFLINAQNTARIELKLPFVTNLTKKQYQLAFVLPMGKSAVKIEGAKVSVKPI